MAYLVAVSACLFALAFGSLPAGATSPELNGQLDVNLIVETDDPTGRVDTIDARIDDAIIEDLGAPELPIIEPLEPGAPSESWDENEELSGVAFPVTDDISFGLDYELEELEELTTDRIEMGSASADHESHNVMLRANWKFDLRP